MRNKALLLAALLIASGSVLAEQNTLGNAGKQLLKDTAKTAAPKEAVEGVEKAGQTVENADKAKESVKTVEKTTKTAKKVKGQVPKSSKEATKAAKARAQEEATKKALDTLK